MTVATQITIFRILLIPVFVGFAIYYGQSVAEGAPDFQLRLWAIAAFAIASISDAVDGYVARHFNQRSRLGAILDPLADKMLLLSAILTLSFTTWDQQFPLWFPLLVIFRDVTAIGGAFVVDHITGSCNIKPHWTGKVATALQMVAILWILIDIRVPPLLVPTALAGLFTATSGFIYLADGLRQIHHSGHH